MKAKVKLRLVETSFYRFLELRLKMEGEWSYWHNTIIIGNRRQIYGDQLNSEQYLKKKK